MFTLVTLDMLDAVAYCLCTYSPNNAALR